MSTPDLAFLDMVWVEALHERSLLEYGGTPGCRDRGLVESALGSAQNAYCYGSGDAFDVAAAYAFHIAQAQAYLDGNKRTAVATALAFLAGNGFTKPPTSEFLIALYQGMIAIAERRMDKPGLAALMRDYFTKEL
jgi:death on curing protein